MTAVVATVAAIAISWAGAMVFYKLGVEHGRVEAELANAQRGRSGGEVE